MDSIENLDSNHTYWENKSRNKVTEHKTIIIAARLKITPNKKATHQYKYRNLLKRHTRRNTTKKKKKKKQQIKDNSLINDKKQR